MGSPLLTTMNHPFTIHIWTENGPLLRHVAGLAGLAAPPRPRRSAGAGGGLGVGLGVGLGGLGGGVWEAPQVQGLARWPMFSWETAGMMIKSERFWGKFAERNLKTHLTRLDRKSWKLWGNPGNIRKTSKYGELQEPLENHRPDSWELNLFPPPPSYWTLPRSHGCMGFTRAGTHEMGSSKIK